jgi:hypothetical protein
MQRSVEARRRLLVSKCAQAVSNERAIRRQMVDGRRRVARLRGLRVDWGREEGGERDRSGKNLHVTSPIDDGEAVSGYTQ